MITQNPHSRQEDFKKDFPINLEMFYSKQPFQKNKLNGKAYVLAYMSEMLIKYGTSLFYESQRTIGEECSMDLERETVNRICAELCEDGLLDSYFRGNFKTLAYELNPTLQQFIITIRNGFIHFTKRFMEFDLLFPVRTRSLDSMSYVTHIYYMTIQEIKRMGLAMLKFGGETSKDGKKRMKDMREQLWFDYHSPPPDLFLAS